MWNQTDLNVNLHNESRVSSNFTCRWLGVFLTAQRTYRTTLTHRVLHTTPRTRQSAIVLCSAIVPFQMASGMLFAYGCRWHAWKLYIHGFSYPKRCQWIADRSISRNLHVAYSLATSLFDVSIPTLNTSWIWCDVSCNSCGSSHILLADRRHDSDMTLNTKKRPSRQLIRMEQMVHRKKTLQNVMAQCNDLASKSFKKVLCMPPVLHDERSDTPRDSREKAWFHEFNMVQQVFVSRLVPMQR